MSANLLAGPVKGNVRGYNATQTGVKPRDVGVLGIVRDHNKRDTTVDVVSYRSPGRSLRRFLACNSLSPVPMTIAQPP